jgi:hypothetical protein
VPLMVTRASAETPFHTSLDTIAAMLLVGIKEMCTEPLKKLMAKG